MTWLNTPCTAFEGSQRIATGALNDVAPVAKGAVDKWAASHAPLAVLIFNDATSEVIELDWRGSPDEFAARLAAQAAALEASTTDHQPAAETSSSSAVSPRGPGRPKLGVVAREVTLRKLVEEASRALFAGDQARLDARIGAWPVDVQAHLRKVLADAFFWA